MKIEIIVNSSYHHYELMLDTGMDFFEFNNKLVQFDTNIFKNRLFDIISTWQENIWIDGAIDTESYKIKITDKQHNQVFMGNASLPHNYNDLIKLLEEVSCYE